MANYILQNTAAQIDTALSKVLNADTSPTATDALVTSQGVKTYVDNAIQGVGTDTSSIEADITALETTVNGLLPTATMSLANYTFYQSSAMTAWTVTDPHGFINYNSTYGSFSLRQDTVARAGVFAWTIKFNATDTDLGSDRFDMRYYNPNVSTATGTGSSVLFNLNNLQNAAFRTYSAFITSPTNSHAFYMHEANPNTTCAITNCVVTITKIAGIS